MSRDDRKTEDVASRVDLPPCVSATGSTAKPATECDSAPSTAVTEPNIAAMLETYYDAMHDSRSADAYHRRHGVESACILTVYDDERADLILEYLRPRIEGKVVVESGAGIGLLACHLATVARRYYAIEVDPAWTSTFLACLYAKKPKNLTFIFGAAEDAPPLVADVALFCTHSGHSALYRAASRFAPEVIDVYAELIPPERYAAVYSEAEAAIAKGRS